MRASFTPLDAPSWVVVVEHSSDDAGFVSIKVPFPDDYPPTTFRQTSDAIAELLLSYKTKDDTAILHTFYVHPAGSLDATSAEKRAVKGLGKRMLCHAVRFLLTRGSITLDARLSLEASGGRFDDDMVNRMMHDHTEVELDAFLMDFPTSIANLVEDLRLDWIDIPLVEKAALRCMYDENQKLVRYYKTYGLQVLPHLDKSERDVAYEPMQGTVHDVMNACDERSDVARRGGCVVQSRYRRSPRRMRT
jgi:hypothetical protein